MDGSTAGVQGTVVAITGGARGIGYHCAQQLVAAGARVAIGDIDEPQLARAAAELGVAAHARLDVTDPASFDAFLDHVEAALGPLDVLINNAGIMAIGPLADETDHASRRMVEINLLGVVYGSKLALRRMLPRRRGHVINMASLAGETYVPGGVTYCATKHAVKAFTETARREYRGSGVVFSQVQPTFTNTELVAGAAPARGARNAEPEEVAAAVVALVARPRPRVRVTRLAGALTASQALLPRVVGERLGRWFGLEHAFLAGVDPVARAAYEQRILSN